MSRAQSGEPDSGRKAPAPADKSEPSANSTPDDLQTATFGGGCFWCTEAVFQRLKGVKSVVSGYSGGNVPNPTYKQVSSGLTGHAEVVQVTFDPKVISYKDLLEIFWQSHDPTTLNRQGPDVGTQYRSAIFYVDSAQRRSALAFIAQLNARHVYPAPIALAAKRT